MTQSCSFVDKKFIFLVKMAILAKNCHFWTKNCQFWPKKGQKILIPKITIFGQKIFNFGKNFGGSSQPNPFLAKNGHKKMSEVAAPLEPPLHLVCWIEILKCGSRSSSFWRIRSWTQIQWIGLEILSVLLFLKFENPSSGSKVINFQS